METLIKESDLPKLTKEQMEKWIKDSIVLFGIRYGKPIKVYDIKNKK